MRGQLRDLQTQIEGLRKQAEADQTEIARLRELVPHNAELGRRLHEREFAFQALNTQLRTLQEQFLKQNEELSRLHLLEHQLPMMRTQIEHQLAELQRQAELISRQTIELGNLRPLDARNRELIARNEELTAQLRALTERLGHLTGELEPLRKQSEEFHRLKALSQDLHGQLTTLQEQYARLAELARKTTLERDDLNGALLEAQSLVRRHGDRIGILENDILSSRQRNEQLEREIRQETERRHQAESSARSSGDRIGILERELHTVRQLNAQLLAQLNEQTQRRQELQLLVTRLNASLEQQEALSQAHLRQVVGELEGRFNREILDLRTRLRATEEDRNRLVEENLELRAEILQLRAEVAMWRERALQNEAPEEQIQMAQMQLQWLNQLLVPQQRAQSPARIEVIDEAGAAEEAEEEDSDDDEGPVALPVVPYLPPFNRNIYPPDGTIYRPPSSGPRGPGPASPLMPRFTLPPGPLPEFLRPGSVYPFFRFGQSGLTTPNPYSLPFLAHRDTESRREWPFRYQPFVPRPNATLPRTHSDTESGSGFVRNRHRPFVPRPRLTQLPVTNTSLLSRAATLARGILKFVKF